MKLIPFFRAGPHTDNHGLIDSITESVNQFGHKLIGEGALLGFECWSDPARNP